MTELMNIFKTMPAYLISLFENHTIVMITAAIVFLYVTFFSGKIASKVRSIFVLASLLMIVFSFISQSWPRIALICVGLLVLLACRIFGYIISEIRIVRRNRRLEERALEKAAKRRGSWQNKQGYSGARKPIIEPEYIPEEMNSDEIADVIENEFADPVKESNKIDAVDTDDVIADDFEETDDTAWTQYEVDGFDGTFAVDDVKNETEE